MFFFYVYIFFIYCLFQMFIRFVGLRVRFVILCIERVSCACASVLIGLHRAALRWRAAIKVRTGHGGAACRSLPPPSPSLPASPLRLSRGWVGRNEGNWGKGREGEGYLSDVVVFPDAVRVRRSANPLTQAAVALVLSRKLGAGAGVVWGGSRGMGGGTWRGIEEWGKGIGGGVGGTGRGRGQGGYWRKEG